MARIVFNSEQERLWWVKIVENLHMGDDLEETIERYNEWAEKESPDDIINTGMAEFWKAFFHQSYEYVDSTTPPVMLDDSIINGMCSDCGEMYEGVEEGELTIEDYIRLVGKDKQTLCSYCYVKQKEKEYKKEVD